MRKISNKEEVEQFLNEIDIFLLDCDGVLWRGDEVIPDIIDTLKLLRSRNKRIFFVTNNASKSRKSYQKKFSSLGIDCDYHEILNSSFAAAWYLQDIGFKKRVYVIGQDGITEELREVGIESYGGSEDVNKPFDYATFAKNFKAPEDVGAVVIGIDDKFNNYKLATGTHLLRTDPNILFVATNTDACLPYSGGFDFPGAGAFVTSLATASGRQPDMICGKPSQLLLNYVVNKFDLKDRSRVCMVGDRTDTDMLMGNQGNTHTLLVLTGVAKEKDLDTLTDKDQIPKTLIASFGDLYSLTK
ncbi:phosphoglycolate phosphatase [Acrasis kona]|uniref:Phosphoglycolate phosphatase n=1 Tax=Acrasis kona TaxID=1008807 RepID=A0AAW2Z1V2_9EUKA